MDWMSEILNNIMLNVVFITSVENLWCNTWCRTAMSYIGWGPETTRALELMCMHDRNSMGYIPHVLIFCLCVGGIGWMFFGVIFIFSSMYMVYCAAICKYKSCIIDVTPVKGSEVTWATYSGLSAPHPSHKYWPWNIRCWSQVIPLQVEMWEKENEGMNAVWQKFSDVCLHAVPLGKNWMEEKLPVNVFRLKPRIWVHRWSACHVADRYKLTLTQYVNTGDQNIISLNYPNFAEYKFYDNFMISACNSDHFQIQEPQWNSPQLFNSVVLKEDGVLQVGTGNCTTTSNRVTCFTFMEHTRHKKGLD